MNPSPLGFDVLPDVFGCLLIFFGLNQLAYFNEDIEKAKKIMLYLSAVEAVRFFTMKTVAEAEISSNRMLAVTAFAIAEGILFVGFYRRFFAGVSYFAMRNDCDKAFDISDGTRFLSYLSLFSKIIATLVPELVAILELEHYVATDFDVADLLAALIAAKPLVVVFLSLIAFGIGVIWFISIFKLLKSLYSECGKSLDERFFSEFSSRPERVRAKRVKRGVYILVFAILFSLNIVFDNVRIIPLSFMFLFMFIGAFTFKSISGFKKTKIFAMGAFLIMLISEIFTKSTVIYAPVTIYETELWVVLAGLAISFVTVPVCLLCVRGFLNDLKVLSSDLGLKEVNTNAAWIAFCVMMVLWSMGFAVPYLNFSVSTLRVISSAVFIWQCGKVLLYIKEAFEEKTSLS